MIMARSRGGSWASSGRSATRSSMTASSSSTSPMNSPTVAVSCSPSNSSKLFTALSMIAEFEADLARMRTWEGMAIAKAKGRLRGKKPKLSASQPTAPGGRSAPGDVDLATEVAALAALLAEVVQLAGASALFPSRWAQLAELALEHDSVRAALQAERPPPTAPLNADTSPLSTERIIAQLNGLHDLIRDGHARS